MKALKIALVAVGGIVLLVLIGLGMLLATFDADKYKPELIRVVKDKTGRTLKIAGPIGLSAFPTLGLALDGVELSEPGSDKIFARIGKLRASLALLPLLSREVVVDRVVVSGLSADVVRHKDGATNIDDLLSGGKGKGDKGDKGAASAPTEVKLDIAGIDIGADRLGWRDERDGTDLRLSEFSLNTGRISDDAPGKLELAAHVQGTQPRIDVKINLSTGYRFAFDRGAAALDGMALKVTGNLPGASGADVSLKGDIESDSAKGLLKVASLELNFKSADGVDVSLAVPALLASPGKSAEGNATLAFKLDKPDLALQGKLSTPVSANVEAKTLQMSRLSGDLSVSGSGIPQKNLKLSLSGGLDANWGKKSASGKLDAKIDDSSVKSQFSVNAAETPPAIGFSVEIDQLDVDRYRQPPPAGGATAAKASAGADKPMDLSVLRSLNLNGQIKAGRVTASRVKIEKLAAALRVSGGRADIASLSANLYGGTLQGSAGIDADGKRATVKQQLSGVNIGPLLRDAIDKDFIEGNGNVALDVVSSGLTVGALKKGLNGTASVSLRDGAVKGINLAESFRKAKSFLGAAGAKAGAQDQAASKGDKTDFAELSASFHIHDGVAHNDDLSLKSPFIRLGGSGDINIGADSMDYLAKASVVGTASGQGGKDVADLHGLTIPVRLSGPFDGLKYHIDFGSMVGGALKQQVQDTVKTQVQDRLKGLFKR